MRSIVYIGRRGCAQCYHLREEAVKPLMERYPRNVSIHEEWDRAVERVNRASLITRIPLIVVYCGEVEEFRFSGPLSYDDLEAIVECEAETLTIEQVLDGDL